MGARPKLSGRLKSIPWISANLFKLTTCPSAHATATHVSPLQLVAIGLAPALSSAEITVTLPAAQARHNEVSPTAVQAASTPGSSSRMSPKLRLASSERIARTSSARIGSASFALTAGAEVFSDHRGRRSGASGCSQEQTRPVAPTVAAAAIAAKAAAVPLGPTPKVQQIDKADETHRSAPHRRQTSSSSVTRRDGLLQGERDTR
mmetsp:Transcript_82442/g.229766  ORF Transcript_82442/g.229766 Transcript_82442/m.229766 type:complete len:205 (+) Transcript_82442:562-1176(+)